MRAENLGRGLNQCANVLISINYMAQRDSEEMRQQCFVRCATTLIFSKGIRLSQREVNYTQRLYAAGTIAFQQILDLLLPCALH